MTLISEFFLGVAKDDHLFLKMGCLVLASQFRGS